MNKIGIISDTHKKYEYAKEIIELFVKKEVDFIIHAGDIVDVNILELIKKTKIKYIAVYGNNDAHLSEFHSKYNLVQEPHYFKYAQREFKLMHLPFYMSGDADIIVFGHTHTFECDFKNGRLFLNPGESCARKKDASEAAILEIEEHKYNVTHLVRKLKNTHFKETHFTFEIEE